MYTTSSVIAAATLVDALVVVNAVLSGEEQATVQTFNICCHLVAALRIPCGFFSLLICAAKECKINYFCEYCGSKHRHTERQKKNTAQCGSWMYATKPEVHLATRSTKLKARPNNRYPFPPQECPLVDRCTSALYISRSCLLWNFRFVS